MEETETEHTIDVSLIHNRRSQRDVRTDCLALLSEAWEACGHDSNRTIRDMRKRIADDGELILFAMDTGHESLLGHLRHKSRVKLKPPTPQEQESAEARLAQGYAALSKSLLESYRLFDGTLLAAATRDHVARHLAHLRANVLGNFRGAYVMSKLLENSKLKGGATVGRVFDEAAVRTLFEAAEQKRLVVEDEPEISFGVA